jgi:CRP-like cAMP-binding protein
MSSSTEENQGSSSSEFQENLEILRQMDFFSALSLEALKLFAYLATRENFKVGDFLFHQDDNDGNAFYIISGKAELLRQDEGGDSNLKIYSEGEFLGGLALLGDMRRLFSLRASTDMTCLVLNRDKFSKALEQFPELTPKVFRTVVEKVRAWEERLMLDPDQLCDRCRHKVGVSLI